MSKEYGVGGMTCGGCVRSVTDALERALPGRAIAVDLARGVVRVDGPHDEGAVQRAVEAAGFDWGGAAPPAPPGTSRLPIV